MTACLDVCKRRGYMTGVVLEKIYSWLYPMACRVCGSQTYPMRSGGICKICWMNIPLFSGPCCPRCGTPIHPASCQSPDRPCPDCRRRPPPYNGCISAGRYEGALAQAIHLFKYAGRTGWTRPLADLLLARVGRFPALDAVLPVPLHPRRLREREFNQSLLLARAVSRPLGLSLQPDNLSRIRWTPSQVELSREDRRGNVQGAFAVRSPKRIEGLSVLLVDDVMTTGSTVEECVWTLKRAGAGKVYVLTVARMG